ncbi:MAG: hypothetical protein QXP81_09855 [Nitrososphaerota archaeon]
MWGVVGTGTVSVDASRSFYARVGSDYRVHIPSMIREIEGIEPGDVVWLLIGTVIKQGKRVIVP